MALSCDPGQWWRSLLRGGQLALSLHRSASSLVGCNPGMCFLLCHCIAAATFRVSRRVEIWLRAFVPDLRGQAVVCVCLVALSWPPSRLAGGTDAPMRAPMRY